MNYKVTLCANRPNATCDGYGQWYQAYDEDGRFAGAWLPADSPSDMTYTVAVLTVDVVAADAITACRKMRHWQNEGLDAAWLLLPNNDNGRTWPVYEVSL